METIFKTWTPEIKLDEPANPENRRMTFTVSTGAIDRDRDSVNPKGWQLDHYKRNPVVLFAHDYKSMPVAKAIRIDKTDTALIATAEFPAKGVYAFADQVYDMLKAGFLNATSVGFRPTTQPSFNKERGGMDFEEQELMEFSIVPIPSNPEALVQQRHGGQADAIVKSWCKTILDMADAKKPAAMQDDLLGQIHEHILLAYANIHHAKQSLDTALGESPDMAVDEPAEKAMSGTHKASVQSALGAMEKAAGHAMSAAASCAQYPTGKAAESTIKAPEPTTHDRPTDHELVLELLDSEEPDEGSGATAEDVDEAIRALAPLMASMVSESAKSAINQMLGKID